MRSDAFLSRETSGRSETSKRAGVLRVFRRSPGRERRKGAAPRGGFAPPSPTSEGKAAHPRSRRRADRAFRPPIQWGRSGLRCTSSVVSMITAKGTHGTVLRGFEFALRGNEPLQCVVVIESAFVFGVETVTIFRRPESSRWVDHWPKCVQSFFSFGRIPLSVSGTRRDRKVLGKGTGDLKREWHRGLLSRLRARAFSVCQTHPPRMRSPKRLQTRWRVGLKGI